MAKFSLKSQLYFIRMIAGFSHATPRLAKYIRSSNSPKSAISAGLSSPKTALSVCDTMAINSSKMRLARGRNA